VYIACTRKDSGFKAGKALNSSSKNNFSGDIIDHLREKIFAKYDIPFHKKLVLFLATFESYNGNGIINYNLELIKQALDKKWDGDFHILYSLHNNKNKDLVVKNSYVTDASDYDNISELMSVVDVGITNCSSWIQDFCLQKKPCFLIDIDADSLKTTYPLATSSAELAILIKDFDMQSYLNIVH
jgi:CDP-glycerol glycerophosphotransferase